LVENLEGKKEMQKVEKLEKRKEEQKGKKRG
jgi:hypothetical protein